MYKTRSRPVIQKNGWNYIIKIGARIVGRSNLIECRKSRNELIVSKRKRLLVYSLFKKCEQL